MVHLTFDFYNTSEALFIMQMGDYPAVSKYHYLSLNEKENASKRSVYQNICNDIKPVRKEEGKSYWKIPLCDDDATREK